MNIEIINIGDELLIGQVVNTNASWMSEQLNHSGFSVRKFTIIGDSREEILDALHKAGEQNDLVLISGGLGPTKDDITKTTVCEFFNTRLVFNEDAFRDIEGIFARRGYKVTELNRQQAFLPENCISIPNHLGTARGMWFEQPKSHDSFHTSHALRPSSFVLPPSSFVFLPGVPFEMKAMMTREVIPRLKKIFHPKAIHHKTILTQGIGESFLAAQLEEWENHLPASVKLAYLPQPGIVRLRLTASGDDEAMVREIVETESEKLVNIIPQYIFGTNEDKLEEIIGKLLKEKGKTLATAESCTGGYIAHMITSIPGSSVYFKGSVVAYSNEIKQEVLGVPEETLRKHGAVSRETVIGMAQGAVKIFNTDYAIAVSGIAGPDGGTAEKPVGTCWIAITGPEGVSAEHYLFGDDRERNIRRAGLQALNLLRKRLLGEKEKARSEKRKAK